MSLGINLSSTEGRLAGSSDFMDCESWVGGIIARVVTPTGAHYCHFLRTCPAFVGWNQVWVQPACSCPPEQNQLSWHSTSPRSSSCQVCQTQCGTDFIWNKVFFFFFKKLPPTYNHIAFKSSQSFWTLRMKLLLSLFSCEHTHIAHSCKRQTNVKVWATTVPSLCVALTVQGKDLLPHALHPSVPCCHGTPSLAPLRHMSRDYGGPHGSIRQTNSSQHIHGFLEFAMTSILHIQMKLLCQRIHLCHSNKMVRCGCGFTHYPTLCLAVTCLAAIVAIFGREDGNKAYYSSLYRKNMLSPPGSTDKPNPSVLLQKVKLLMPAKNEHLTSLVLLLTLG